MFLSDISIKRPVLVSMIMAAFIIFGIIAYVTLPLNITPELELPYVFVQVVYPGASPDLIESQISKKVEDEVSNISGLKTITSYSLENVAFILLKFNINKDADIALQEVTAKVNYIKNDFPDDAEEPIMMKININEMPIIRLMVSGNSNKISMTELFDLADKKIKNSLSQIPGVGNIELVGGLKREIHVEFDNRTIFENNISMVNINALLAASNINLPAGYFQNEGQEFSVKFDGEVKTVDAIGNIEIPMKSGMKRLKDIAAISDTNEKARKRAIYFNFDKNIRNDNTILLSIVKTSEGNSVEIKRATDKVIKAMSKDLPEGVELFMVSEEATLTENSVNDTISNILLGIAFTAAVLLFFLHSFRSTLIVAITMPLSILPTFIIFKAMGFSLNIMSLMGLSTAVGVLVMNSVVILENIFRHKELGRPGKIAASQGTSEITVAVLASSLTNIAVFFPLGTMSGMIGKFLFEFAFAVVFATIFSLFIAFTLTPMLAAYILPERDTRNHPIGDKLEILFHLWEAGYKKLLIIMLKTKKRCFFVIVIIIGLFISSIYCFKYIPFEFTPQTDGSKINIEVELPKGYDISETSEFIKKIENRTKKYSDMIQHGVTTIGSTSSLETGVNLAKISLTLTPKKERKYTSIELASMITKDLSDIPGAVIRVASSSSTGGSSSPIDFYIKGSDINKLDEYKNMIMPQIEKIPGIVNLNSSIRSGVPEITIVPDKKKIAEAGISIQEISLILRTSLEGITMTQFKEGGEEYDIVVLLKDNTVKSYEDIKNISIPSPSGVFPLSHFAEVDFTEGFNKIIKSDREKVIEITSDIAPGYAQGPLMAQIEKVISTLDFPFGYKYQPAGSAEEMTKTIKEMFFVFIIAIILTYMILAAILENLWQPLLILLTVPMAIIGIVAIYLLLKQTLNFVGMMAIIMLVGMVVNNAILILDYTNILRRQGKTMHDALIEACPTKLKAILMSNIATILGLLPMALGIGKEMVEMRQPMGIVSIGGLITSTILTLFIIPATQYLVTNRKKVLHDINKEMQEQAANLRG